MKLRNYFSQFLVLLLILGCSSNSAKQVEKDMDKVQGVHSRDEMINKTREILEKSKLSTDQKEKFLELHGQMIIQVNGLNEEFNKLKVILFSEMTKNKRNKAKINEVTRQIKKIHNDKLNIMLSSLDKVDKILGDKASSIYQENWFLDHLKP